eukprot:1161671-Pelagomonas_calceolata.AAC.35
MARHSALGFWRWSQCRRLQLCRSQSGCTLFRLGLASALAGMTCAILQFHCFRLRAVKQLMLRVGVECARALCLRGVGRCAARPVFLRQYFLCHPTAFLKNSCTVDGLGLSAAPLSALMMSAPTMSASHSFTAYNKDVLHGCGTQAELILGSALALPLPALPHPLSSPSTSNIS